MRNGCYSERIQCTSELVDRGAHLAHAHISVSRHSEGVELTTAQVQEGAAALSRVTGGVNTCSRRGFNGVVLCCAGLAPHYRQDITAAVLVNRSVLRFTRSWRRLKEEQIPLHSYNAIFSKTSFCLTMILY